MKTILFPNPGFLSREFFRCVIAQAFCSQKSFREITLNYAINA